MTNVLVYMADNLSSEIATAAMPFLNGEFAQLGARYTRFYNQVPECTPSRVAMLTGQYPHNNLCFQNGELFGVGGRPAETSTLAPLLNSTTNCATWGKQYDFTLGEETRPGFDYVRSLSENWGQSYGYEIWNGSAASNPSGHVMSYITTDVVSWIESGPAEPFFAWVCPPMPHVQASGTFLSKPTPDSIHHHWFAVADIPFLTDTTDKPSWIASRPEPTEVQKAQIRTAWIAQCRSAFDVDQQFQTIVETLDAEDLLDDTIVAFVSDNGIMFGRQRMDYGTNGTQQFVAINANVIYEPLIRTPCVIAGPGFTAGSTETGLVMMADVCATIHDVLGVAPTLAQDGQSLLDPISPSRQLLCASRQTDIAPECDGIITSTRRLVRYDDTGTDEFEMYDLDTDPDEFLNVAFDGDRLQERNDLEDDLDALLA